MTLSGRREQLQALLRPEVRALQPYEPEPAGPAMRLDANESPYDFPETLKQEILKGLGDLPWNRYPDPSARQLCQALAKFEGVSPDQIVAGNGSDEIIRDLLAVYGGPGTRVLFPTPTFSMYRLLALAAGCTPVGIRLRADWSLDLPALMAELESPANRILFLASPNNPTGNCFPVEQLETIVQSTDRLVVVDEAYRRFCDCSMRSRLEHYPNLAILNTFSKSMSLAGLRVGYLLADPEVIRAVHRVRLPYNLDSVAQFTATRALDFPEIWEHQARQVINERIRISQALSQLPEVVVYPSQANFILVRLAQAQALRQDLAAQGVAVRGFGSAEGLGDCLRVTVGRPEENDLFLNSCRDFFKRAAEER